MMFSLLKLASFALVASSGAYAQEGPSSALRGASTSSQGPNYELKCTQPNKPATCMSGKKSTNALAACCVDFGDKTVGYTCADGTVFCCNDPQKPQYNDGSPSTINPGGYKDCYKVVPDFEEAMTA